MEAIKFYAKEIQIMRQSQQKMAFDYSKSKGYLPTIMELQRMTDLFVEVCLRPLDTDLKKRITNLDVWLSEKTIDTSLEIDGVLY
jgi:hypothetical protein